MKILCRTISVFLFFVIAVNAKTQEEWVVFIHGTLGLRHNFEWRTFIALFKDDINNTPYKKTIEILREDPFLYQNQPIQELGLHEVDATKTHTHGATLFIELFHQMYQPLLLDTQTTRYFTFGWSGLVSVKIRQQEASKFYEQLRKKILEAEKNDIEVKLTLYGYSHGGNVGLNLGSIRNRHYPNDTFVIENMILLGTPIQRETDHLVCHSMFKKIYHIYSRADRIQTLDCFSFKRFFSRRRFRTCRRYTIPNNLMQIEVRVKDYIKGHWYDRSPGHIELWFFGWPEHNKSLYRPYFPFYPLPIALFVPNIIDIVNESKKEKHVIVELRPHEHRASLRNRHKYNRTWIDFLSSAQINHLRTYANQQKPLLFDRESYLSHIQGAANLAEILISEHALTKSTDSLCGS